jgi:glycogen debranching enzyme
MATSNAKSKPPDLRNEVSILHGETFMVCNSLGSFTPPGPYGLFHRDTRFLSLWDLTLNGEQPALISSKAIDHFSAAFFLTNQNGDGLSDSVISIVRLRVLSKRVNEELIVENHGTSAVSLNISLAADTDFADLFEVKSSKADEQQREINRIVSDERLVFEYGNQKFFRRTSIGFSQQPALSSCKATWSVSLDPQVHWKVCIAVETETEPGTIAVPVGIDAFEKCYHEMQNRSKLWSESLPVLHSSSDQLDLLFANSCTDIGALRIHDHPGLSFLPAAGLPWFMTVFGRDSIIASYQSLILGKELAQTCVFALSERQATTSDDFRDSDPGKILHEIRHGELTVMGQEPYSPYYGSIDSTVLFIILCSEIYRWTADANSIRQLAPAIKNALHWIEKYGDSDGDSYVEYITRSSKGLRNQGWKDSETAIQFSDGRIARPPIALCEVQGYVYDAFTRMGELFHVLEEPSSAKTYEQKAQALKNKFNKDFWIDERGGYFALALDAEKKRVDAIGSNMGQLLWSGIVEPEKAQVVVDQLMSGHMYSGWGIRTLSQKEHGFNPIAYHCGTVWPHDNSLIAAGLRRYNFHDQARTVIEGMLQAGTVFDFRFPEVFAGYPKHDISFPCRYPTSCRPQAWAAGATLLFLRTMLGLEPDMASKTLYADPLPTASIRNLKFSGLQAFGKTFDLVVTGGSVDVKQR